MGALAYIRLDETARSRAKNHTKQLNSLSPRLVCAHVIVVSNLLPPSSMPIIDFYFDTATAIITFIETNRTKKEAFTITPNQHPLGQIQPVRKDCRNFNLSRCLTLKHVNHHE